MTYKVGAGYLLLWLCVFIFSADSYAQEITFNASVNRNPVAAGERFTITFTLTNAQAKVSPPDLSDFNILFGPSTSSSYSNINGRASTTTAISYVVIAEKEGKYTIGKAKAYTDKGVLETDPITVTVEKNPYGSAQSTQSAQAPQTNQKGEIITSISLNKTRAHIGEPIAVTYYLYSRYTNLELGKYEFPTLNGFWTEDLKIENASWENQLATINGNKYRVAVLKRQVIYPQKSGTLVIKPFEVECFVNRSFFSTGTKIMSSSNAQEITVLPFPPGAPGGFNEVTGNYKIEASVNNKEVKANEPVTYKLKISGEGNLRILNPPGIEFPSDFEVYDPKTNDRIKVSSSGLNGSREFEYLIIPRVPGEYIIPPVSFSYFNLASKSYKTITTPEFKLTVKEGDPNQAGTYTPGQSKVTVLNQDIRYIITDPPTVGVTSPMRPDHPLFWVMFSSMPLALLGFFVIKRKNDELKKDTVKLKASTANKVAVKRLAEAKKALVANDSNKFYEATFRAIYGYIADKINIPVADLSHKVVEEKLLQFNVDKATVNDVLNTIEMCEMARFAPVNNISLQQVYDKATEQIAKLEKTLK